MRPTFEGLLQPLCVARLLQLGRQLSKPHEFLGNGDDCVGNGIFGESAGNGEVAVFAEQRDLHRLSLSLIEFR